jgi:hypothetical protein
MQPSPSAAAIQGHSFSCGFLSLYLYSPLPYTPLTTTLISPLLSPFHAHRPYRRDCARDGPE